MKRRLILSLSKDEGGKPWLQQSVLIVRYCSERETRIAYENHSKWRATYG